MRLIVPLALSYTTLESDGTDMAGQAGAENRKALDKANRKKR